MEKDANDERPLLCEVSSKDDDHDIILIKKIISIINRNNIKK